MKSFLLALALVVPVHLLLAQTEDSDEIRDLNREASRIENDMLIQHSDLEKRNPELEVLAGKAAKAASAAKHAVDTHPALADLRLRRDAAYAKLTVIMGKGTKGEDAEKQSAQEVYVTAERNLSEKARELPEVQSLVEAASAAQADHLRWREAFYAAQPETAAMAKKVAALRAKATELKTPKE